MLLPEDVVWSPPKLSFSERGCHLGRKGLGQDWEAGAPRSLTHVLSLSPLKTHLLQVSADKDDQPLSPCKESGKG